MNDLHKLMQMGEAHWTERASCLGDPRFTQQNPPENGEADELSQICRDCDVFFECLEFHDEWAATAVFAHGEWRYDDDAVSDSDTVPYPADEYKRAT